MTVEELIKILNELPLEAEIVVLQHDRDVDNSDKLTSVVYHDEYSRQDESNKLTKDINNYKKVVMIAD